MAVQGAWNREIPLQYLLCVSEFLEEEKGGPLLEAALGRVDEHRRAKALKARQGMARAASLGAGLLLQLAVGEALEDMKNPAQETGCEENPARSSAGCILSVSEALDRLEGRPFIPLSYGYGDRGKPKLNFPFCFSLSHSGAYVLCALSGAAVGADIQRHQKCEVFRLAERFFSERENEALKRAAVENHGETELFYRLWTRKEAWGKLTGRGIGDGLGQELLPGEETYPGGRRLIWEETAEIAGYSLAVCRQEKKAD